MSLIRVVLNRSYKDSLLYQLSKINAVHIKSKTGAHLKEFLEHERLHSDKIKILRDNLNTLFKKLKISKSEFQELKFNKNERIEFIVKDLHELLNHTLEEINFFYNRVIELESYITRAKIELENINIIKKTYVFLEKFNLTRDFSTYFKHLKFKVYTTFLKNLPTLKNLFELPQFPNVYQTYQFSEDRIAFYIIYPNDKEEDLKERIGIIHAEEVPILKKYLTSEGINFERINKELDLIEKTLSKYRKELQRLRDDNLLKFAAISEIVQNIEEYLWAEDQFEELPTGQLSLKFFTPIWKKQEIFQILQKRFTKNIFIDSIDIEKGKPISEFNDIGGTSLKAYSVEQIKQRDFEETEDAISNKKDEEEDIRSETPTIMRNFFLFRPFETLTRMYGTPSYSEVDPTPFLAITFPLLFGIMFGDIGHGLCLIIAGLLGRIVFRKKGSDFRNFCWIIFYCGWGAVLGGFLYGEFFGMHEIPILGIILEPVTIFNFTLHNPLDNIMTVFIFAILVGVFHINLGWFIQFLNYCKQKRKYLAISDSLCKMALLDGGAVLILVFGLDINAWFSYPYPILFPIIPGLLLIFLKPMGRLLRISYLKEESYGELIGEGSIEIFETVLSVMSNVASYIRLLALALAHIALMIVIQEVIGLIQVPEVNYNDLWQLIYFILIHLIIVIGLIFGNLAIILLEGLLVFLNDIRLHFYEFFFKFYQGAGTEFFPFYLDSDYSIITFEVEKVKDIITEEVEKEFDKKAKDIDKAVSYISRKYF